MALREFVIDANLLLSFVTDRHPVQQEKAAELFLTASRGQAALFIPQSVITEFVYVLDKIYAQPKQRIRQMVADLLALPGVQLIDRVEFGQVLSFWPDQVADFGDALLAAAAWARKGAEVATFDKKLINFLLKVGVAVARL